VARLLVPIALLFLFACASSTPEDPGTSASEVTTADAGADARDDAPCSERYAAGKQTYEAARRSCFCADDVCHEACRATQCLRVATAADATCQACIDASYDQCVQKVESVCEADGECARYVVCTIDSKR
jgi:hypothetical protein